MMKLGSGTERDGTEACRTAVMRGEAELRTYNLKKTSPPQSRSQAVVCLSTPRMYPRSGYFLVNHYSNFESICNQLYIRSGVQYHQCIQVSKAKTQWSAKTSKVSLTQKLFFCVVASSSNHVWSIQILEGLPLFLGTKEYFLILNCFEAKIW